ncbi:MAG: DNRLRE domain-containing protein [Caldilineaceae bacterium]
MLALLMATVLPGAALKAAPPAMPLAQAASNPVELHPTDDARTQSGSPDTNFGNGYLWVGHPEVHYTLIKFDLTVLPADAQITRAELQLYFTGIYTGTNEVEVGRVDGTWDEATLVGSTPVNYTWSGQFQTVTSTGKDDPSQVSWNVTQLAQAWQSGARVNDGLALRGNGGELKAAHSKETGAERNANPIAAPLIITYTLPPDEDLRRPDLGDAPDSTNHHGQNNTAYPGAGVLGQFPTVWESPANQPAGPRHDNETGEGILGEFISREREADGGPDQDGPNNIIRNAAGATGDVADMDRGDDGWRNRGISFFNCTRQSLTVRVSKAQNATLERMYLNVWFDGNRDGDWADQGNCPVFPPLPAPTSYEWIVQNHVVDMTAIPAGGYVDLPVTTERILNVSGGLPHWMRFTLSEARAVQPPSGDLPDGRGPHPNSAQKSFRFGETEDVLQKPPAPGEPGELMLEKRVITHEDPVDYPGEVTYQIRLRHVGGTAPVDAQIRDQLGFPQHLLPRITQSGDIAYIEITSSSGGATPLAANVSYVDGDQPGVLEQLVAWDGTLEPDSEVLLTFDVHVHPNCPALLNTKTITNLARARAVDGDIITAEASYVAKCPGYDADGGIQFEPHENPIDLDDLTQVPWQGTVWNKHPISVSLGIFQEVQDPSRPSNEPETRPLAEITLAPNEKRPIDFDLVIEHGAEDDLSPTPAPYTVGRLYFCIFVGEDNACANANDYPNLEGEIVPPVWVPAPEELGDAPDSTNHFAGVAMTAYTGVQANFPTVFDPGTGADQGPKHSKPQLLHLGPGVSREAEADLGPDADGINNIWPPADANDQDWFDDGARLTNLANCQPARVDVRVNSSQPAVNWFGNNNRVAYLNVWLDSNHDGDWADGFTCVDEASQNKAVVEHILIDYPVDVAALGAGLQTLNNIATGLVGWPAQGANAARWVRFTLSEEPSNKPLNYNGIQYGDGRGYATAFRTGETEDYLWVLAGEQAGGPDVALQLQGQIVPAQDGHEVRLKVDYANVGTTEVNGARLTLSKRVITWIRSFARRAGRATGG